MLAVTVGVAGLAYVVSRVELPVDPTVAPAEKQTSFICSSEVEVSCGASNAMATLHGDQNRETITYEEVPKVLRDAVIAAEDRNYFEHGGVDPLGIARAAWADIRNQGSKQGGSTITQQYVKQTYLTADRTLTRKIKEAVMAVKLEQKISKQEILARYLNTIYFGRGAYGVQAASRTYFKHDVAAITLPEAVFLAGLIRNPNAADPWGLDEAGNPTFREEAKARDERLRRVITNFMVEDGAITDAQRAEAMKVPIVTLPIEQSMVKPREEYSNYGDVQGKEFGTEYFVDYVRRWLTSKSGGGFTEDQVLGGGLKVYTTLDRNMQKAAFDAVTTTLNQPGDPSAALVAVDDQGQVKAMMGGTDFEKSPLNLAAGGNGNRGGVVPARLDVQAVRARRGRQGGLLDPSPRPRAVDQSHFDQGAVRRVRGRSGGGARRRRHHARRGHEALGQHRLRQPHGAARSGEGRRHGQADGHHGRPRRRTASSVLGTGPRLAAATWRRRTRPSPTAACTSRRSSSPASSWPTAPSARYTPERDAGRSPPTRPARSGTPCSRSSSRAAPARQPTSAVRPPARPARRRTTSPAGSSGTRRS